MNIALICISLLGLLALITGIGVTVARGRYNVLTGCPDDPEHGLTKWVRAHGNTCEYAAILGLIIYILGQTEQAAWVLWLMGLVTFSRYLLVVGFLIPRTMAKPNPMRFIGACGTYLFGLGLTITLLIQAMSL